MQYSSFPTRFNCRKNDKLTCSLDGGLDKWQEKNKDSGSTQNISETFSRDDGQSSDSVEHEYAHKNYISTLPPSNGLQEVGEGEKDQMTG